MTLNTVRVPTADTSSRNDYLSILNEAWNAHLAPRVTDAPTVISTFAGCGGSSLGYSMAGYRELLAIEWNANAVDTFKLNFSGVPVYQGDIAKISVEQVLQMTGLKPGELDILDGSPPCQGFSTAGKRRIDDDRNQLFQEYVRLLQGLQPKVFVMENVSGMVKGKMKLIFVEILKALKASGYKVSARLMNAMYFNVPQSRERLIFIGVRNDLRIEPSHPRSMTRPVILRDALLNVINSTIDIEESCYPQTTLSYALLCKMRQWEGGHQYHPHKAMFGLRRLAWNKPSRTVLREDGGGASCQCCHPIEVRRLTIPEIKRVSSYPDEYQFMGNVSERWARIGNSVPPLFMRAIAQHIRDNILERA